MKWTKFTVETTTQAEDLVCGMLTELGIEGLEIQDRQPITREEKEQLYIDILPELPRDDGKAYVSFYLEEGAEETALLEQVRQGLALLASYADAGSCRIVRDVTEDEDWINNWKQFFHPFTVDDVYIIPSWHEITDQEKERYPFLIRIDPGTAFGTGMHETTQLAMRQLRKHVNEQTTLLDVGCGSGILSILALKLGAARAVAVDIDPAAVAAVPENMNANQIPSYRYEVFQGNLLEGQETAKKAGYGCYDVVVANILADVIVSLASVAGAHLKKNGLFLTSGILNTKEEEVCRALLENGFAIEEVTRQNDWVGITARRA